MSPRGTRIGPTRVFWRWDDSCWSELEFVRWTKHFLVVRYPVGSTREGESWRISRKKLCYWHGLGALRIEGEHPFMIDLR